jgi:hypothetical protein
MSSWLERFVGAPNQYSSPAAPVQHPDAAHQYIVDHIVHQFHSENRTIDPYDLHDHIHQHYPSEIATIAAHNEHKRRPPTGMAGSMLSRLILHISEALGLELSPRTSAMHEGKAILSSECKPGAYGRNCPKDFSTEYY